jgi:hypothetical protein
MKNRFIESKKQKAKLYHRNQHGDTFTNGIVARYRYDDMTPETLTFWDDAVFIVNDYRVALGWVHPRDRYFALVKAQARLRVHHLRPGGDRFADMTPNYKTLGRSRKKIVSWTQQPTSEEFKHYYALLSAAQAQVSDELAFEVRPSLKMAWCDWCKSMSLCAPFEVRSEADLVALTKIARRLVKRESTLGEEFGDCVYRQTDWLADCKILDAQVQSRWPSRSVA